MYKLVFFIAMMTVWLSVHLLQIEDELAMKTVFQSKHAVNRAVHAASQQLDQAALGEGVLRIDPLVAEMTAATYLQQNLQLDRNNMPSERSFLKDQVAILVFEVINADQNFPYHYENELYDYEAILTNPGVIMIIQVIFPSRFSMHKGLEWSIKGVSELVVG